MKGYSYPLSPDGRASLVPPPPWHYSGDFLIVEYRTNPDGVIALLPPELEPADDPGAVAAIFADWQSCSDDFHEIVDPIQCQYREFFLVIGGKYKGQPVSRCAYIWVDKDFAMFRGYIQGFPKKLGSIHITRVFPCGKATPKIAPGGRFGATCTANDRQIARAVVTLRQISKEGPKVNAPPMYNTRHFPAASGLRPDVFELVRAGGYDREFSECWEGDAELRLYDDTIEDLQAIAPKEIIKGYRFSFGYSVDGVTVVAQHDKEMLLR
ncbi:MAG: acetoacetate decarboxylase family protein [Thermoflexales bacterium]|nr:acetoacetate decarboxylase family protein [Thermoflexales bacterium]MDW8351895.1 acetoacetate decarboxylase family protein [Anaerolineae bacterium]